MRKNTLHSNAKTRSKQNITRKKKILIKNSSDIFFSPVAVLCDDFTVVMVVCQINYPKIIQYN